MASEELTSTALAELLSQIRQAKADASEASGEAGAATKQACERFSVESKAFSWVVYLSNQEADKRNAVIRSFLALSEKAGFFDQADLFDDLPQRLGLGIGAKSGERPAVDVKLAILGAPNES